MKTTRYKFEQAVQDIKEENREWLKDEFRAILESGKDSTRKADYIGFSILSLDTKVASIDEEIKELQQLKKKLKTAKCISTQVGAEVLAEYGIEKLEGAGVSSISISKETSKEVQIIEILDEQELMNRGYFSLIVDEDRVLEHYNLSHFKEDVQDYCKVTNVILHTPQKLKINKRRPTSKDTKEMPCG